MARLALRMAMAAPKALWIWAASLAQIGCFRFRRCILTAVCNHGDMECILPENPSRGGGVLVRIPTTPERSAQSICWKPEDGDQASWQTKCKHRLMQAYIDMAAQFQT